MKKLQFILMFSVLYLIACVGVEKAPDVRPQELKRDSKMVIKDTKELQTAIASALPGDTLVLAKGDWKDTSILFEANGTKERPIVLTAEIKGEVYLTGNSAIRLAGEYLEVKGLIFKDGFARSGHVFSFRKDAGALANNSRLTECVIQNYSNPAGEDEKWISLYGKNNRVDHNYLQGKSSEGATLVVWLDEEQSQENRHQIDHNFFGQRPPLGRNGAETIRIGTSQTSMYKSLTVVENNYFFRCDGEAEIISIKSAQNVIQNNVFFESKGAVVLRHGNDNIVRHNFFIGNKVADTGGIRVINQGHLVHNNHLQELSGTSNKSSLVVMNGIIDSPLNGYHQVKDVTIRDNMFFDCTPWYLGAGSRPDQSLSPENTLIAHNLFHNPFSKHVLVSTQPLPGIQFSRNTFKLGVSYQSIGFEETSTTYVRDSNGIWKKEGSDDVVLPAEINTTGPEWFKKSL